MIGHDLFILSKSQKVLFYSAIISIIVQILCVYCLIGEKNKFKFDKCFGYLFFSVFSYLFYYKMVLP